MIPYFLTYNVSRYHPPPLPPRTHTHTKKRHFKVSHNPASYNEVKCVSSSLLFVLQPGELEQREISLSYCVANAASNRVTRQPGTTLPVLGLVLKSQSDCFALQFMYTRTHTHVHTPPNPPFHSLNHS